MKIGTDELKFNEDLEVFSLLEARHIPTKHC